MSDNSLEFKELLLELCSLCREHPNEIKWQEHLIRKLEELWRSAGVSLRLEKIIQIRCPCKDKDFCEIYQRLDPSPEFCLNLEKIKEGEGSE